MFFDEYGILGFVAKLGQKPIGSGMTYTDMGISSTILANLSANIWSAWNKKLYDYRADRISFKRHGGLNTFGSGKIVQKKNGEVKEYFPGMVLRLESMEFDDDCFNITEHEKEVIIAYRKQPSLQFGVDRMLGVVPLDDEKEKRA